MTLNKSNPGVTASAKAKSEIQAKKDYRRSNVRRRGGKKIKFLRVLSRKEEIWRKKIRFLGSERKKEETFKCTRGRNKISISSGIAKEKEGGRCRTEGGRRGQEWHKRENARGKGGKGIPCFRFFSSPLGMVASVLCH